MPRPLKALSRPNDEHANGSLAHQGTRLTSDISSGDDSHVTALGSWDSRREADSLNGNALEAIILCDHVQGGRWRTRQYRWMVPHQDRLAGGLLFGENSQCDIRCFVSLVV
jgi:hypothetical protein